MSDIIIKLDDIGKFYTEADGKRVVLEHLDLEIHAADRISIVGPSGSGKSTLLNIIAGLDTINSGAIQRSGLSQNQNSCSDDALSLWRNKHIGFIFQDHHLLPQCNVMENILMPVCAFAAVTDADRNRAAELLNQVDLFDRAQSWPHQLSGGERQRVAVLRSLIMQPSLILADEPTGALDHENSMQIAEMLDLLQQQSGTALLVVTHQNGLAQRMDTCLEIHQHQLRQL